MFIIKDRAESQKLEFEVFLDVDGDTEDMTGLRLGGWGDLADRLRIAGEAGVDTETLS